MRRPSKRQQRGQSMVEFALVLPIMLLLMMGMVDFSRMLGVYLILQHSAREGARLGITGATDSEIVSRVQGTATTLAPSALTVTITPAQGSRTSGSDLTVKCQYPYKLMTPLVSSIVGGTVNLTFTTTYRME